MSNFKKWMQRSDTKKPTQLGFSLDKWKKQCEKLNLSEDDKPLYNFTIYISEKLSDIREKMTKLNNDHFPTNYTYNDALNDIVTFSNYGLMLSVFSIKNSTLKNQNAITSFDENLGMTNEESSHACIDSLNSAIDFCIHHLKINSITSKNPISKSKFIYELCSLSSHYGSIVGYYNGVLYEQFYFINNEDSILLREKKDQFTLSSHECHYRKTIDSYTEKEHNKSDVLSAPELDIHDIHVIKDNKKLRFLIKPSSDENKLHYYYYIYNLGKTFRQCNSDLYESAFSEKGFCSKDLIIIYSHIILLSINHCDLKTQQVESNINSLSVYAFPSKYSVMELTTALHKVSKVPIETIKNIINYMTYDGEKSKDIWAFPFIKINSNHIAILIGATIAPMPDRIVECWLRYTNINVTTKGSSFEVETTRILKSIVDKNNIIRGECDIYSNLDLENNKQREEIDLLIKINKSILIIDLKSIMSVDSPISIFNSMNKVTHGVEQVKRKIEFIKNNIDYVSNYLELDLTALNECSFFPYVLVSNKSLTGCVINDVAIIDRDILFNYFSDGTLKMIHDGNKYHAEMILYKTLNEASQCFDKYFRNQIDTTFNFELYEHLSATPSYDENIIIDRLTRKNISSYEAIERLKRYSEFKIEISNEKIESLITDDITLL
ncbi:nuclease-related domain-containing protein [Aeromonas veronii]|uniref:nuclease-related domain-containing protein n=1 Tax=Aeromonas veronii TaxID=654 RepID=UPI002B459373|nr:nuclease-related domain-containing protein [Aeromonas veronii]